MQVNTGTRACISVSVKSRKALSENDHLLDFIGKRASVYQARLTHPLRYIKSLSDLKMYTCKRFK